MDDWPPGLPPLVSSAPLAGGWVCAVVGGRLADGRSVVVKRCPYPAEIEGFLMEYPAVAQAAVVGVPDERLGQVGKAFVVAKHPVGTEEILAWARDRMAGFKVPRFVEFMDELPLNASGKVRKDQLR